MAQLVYTQLFGQFKDATAPGRERPAQFADVSDDAERALREQIQQRQLTQAQRTRTVPCSAGEGPCSSTWEVNRTHQLEEKSFKYAQR